MDAKLHGSTPDSKTSEQQQGEEVNYEKPEIVAIGNAVQVVESAAKMGEHFDAPPSNAAYSSDE